MDLNRMHQRLIELGEDWADKNSSADLLEESRKSVRAQIAMHYMTEAKTAAKAEMMAEADDGYVEHVKAMVEARRKANLAKVNYEAAKTWIELSRTKEATRRTELQTLGG